MQDQVLNYSEPPFCRSLQDADLTVIQFSLLCHASDVAGSMMANSAEKMDPSISGLAFGGAGILRFTNLLIHRFGIFDFLGFSKAPNTDVDRYMQEVQMGLFPAEIDPTNKGQLSESPILPWTFTPAKDSTTFFFLVEELLHLFIILITEMPSPSPNDAHDHAKEAKRRLRREVVHRLASGPKTHSELAGEIRCFAFYCLENYLSLHTLNCT